MTLSSLQVSKLFLERVRRQMFGALQAAHEPVAYSFLPPPAQPLKKNQTILGFLAQKQAGRQLQGSCQRNPSAQALGTHQEVAHPSGEASSVEGSPHSRAEGPAAGSLGVWVPEAAPAQSHHDSSPHELIRLAPGMKRAILSPKAELPGP